MKIIDTVAIARSKWLNLFEVTYRDHREVVRTWQMTSRGVDPKLVTNSMEIADAVIIVPYHVERRRLVITREYRVPLAGIEYGFPAGLVDTGETLTTTARRELWEETGLEMTHVFEIGPPLFSSAGMTDESVAPVYVACRGEPSQAGNDDGENIEIDFLSPAQARELCRAQDINFDAKAWLIMRFFGETGYICPSQTLNRNGSGPDTEYQPEHNGN